VTRHHATADYAALSDRMRHLLALRFGIAATVLAWSAIRPDVLEAPVTTLAGITGAYLAASLLLEAVRRRAGPLRFTVLTGLLLLDGLYLAYAMYATGGTQSPIRFLTYLHLVAVSLLASYRTGLKIALWHSLLLFAVLYAQAAALLAPVDIAPGPGIEFERMALLSVSAFWLFALATSAFSAMNERELRQHRADLQSLVEVGARLDDADDPLQQARIVLDGLAERFGFRRGIVMGAAEDRLVLLATRGTPDVPIGPAEPDAILRRAWERREPLAVKRVDPQANPLLTAALPAARNVVVWPMIVDGRPVGAIVLEHRSRNPFGIERRVLSIVGQFAAVAALNLRNAVLLRRVQDLAERDALTGVANRRTFQLSLEHILAAPAGPPVTAVLFIDLDDFKVVNDTLGHPVGDALLVAVTERISTLVRRGDLVARLGGDEFAILLDDDPELQRSRAMAERLVRDLRNPFLIAEHHVSVTASIGIASATEVAASASEVVRNADVAMYMAKAKGKARYAVFDPAMHAAVRERHDVAAQLQRAVELDQLRLAYQPIVSLERGEVVALEALVRWEHPERGLLRPGRFISIAEENGAILPIGRWVLREACRDAARWRRTGDTAAEISLCVNVSAREIQQPGFVEAVQETLTESGLDRRRLTLEITEAALLKVTPSTVATLRALRELGVRIVIDDFGTGYFSLSHLRQFPVDALKIASEFVQVSEADSLSSVLAGTIVALSKSLDIETSAEGIETGEQAERMRSLGCTYGQGHFFSAPLTRVEVDERFGARAGAVPVAAAAVAESPLGEPGKAAGRQARPRGRRPAARPKGEAPSGVRALPAT
jgi:diguanylate cyclase (GGDEF)-like protein